VKRKGTAAELEAALRKEYPHAPPLPRVYMQMLPWQMVALYGLAWDQAHGLADRLGGRILEIGSGHGGSAYMIVRAWPWAQFISLTISSTEARIAAEYLAKEGGPHVHILVTASSEFLAGHNGLPLDLIYVDGDHRHCAADLAWFNHLADKGLILFHDYSPQACPPVYAAVNALGQALGREPDVVLMDTNEIGMAGFYRREGERWLG
jgi:predicted O-methyltransferase YrrM